MRLLVCKQRLQVGAARDVDAAQRLNQRITAPKGMNVLGLFDFAAGAKNAVILRTAGADGNIIADAIQIVPAP